MIDYSIWHQCHNQLHPFEYTVRDGPVQLVFEVMTSCYKDIPKRSRSSVAACWAFYQVCPVWVKNVCLHGWTLGAPYDETLFMTPSMTTLFKHTFYRCHSCHREPLLLLIYISIKQYVDNGFIAPLALGQTGERPTADTDRGDWWGTAMTLNKLLLTSTFLKWWICTMRREISAGLRGFFLWAVVKGFYFCIKRCLKSLWNNSHHFAVLCLRVGTSLSVLTSSCASH